MLRGNAAGISFQLRLGFPFGRQALQSNLLELIGWLPVKVQSRCGAIGMGCWLLAVVGCRDNSYKCASTCLPNPDWLIGFLLCIFLVIVSCMHLLCWLQALRMAYDMHFDASFGEVLMVADRITEQQHQAARGATQAKAKWPTAATAAAQGPLASGAAAASRTVLLRLPRVFTLAVVWESAQVRDKSCYYFLLSLLHFMICHSRSAP
jgi:hypothetical protein